MTQKTLRVIPVSGKFANHCTHINFWRMGELTAHRKQEPELVAKAQIAATFLDPGCSSSVASISGADSIVVKWASDDLRATENRLLVRPHPC